MDIQHFDLLDPDPLDTQHFVLLGLVSLNTQHFDLLDLVPLNTQHFDLLDPDSQKYAYLRVKISKKNCQKQLLVSTPKSKGDY